MRRFYLLLTCLLLGFFAGACASSEQDQFEDKIGMAKILEQDGETEFKEMSLYFRNSSYDAGVGESMPVIPVVRSVPQGDYTARAVLNALISGPLPLEQDRYDAGPVINGSDLEIEDIYIKNGVCVIHLSSSHPLPLYNYEGQSDLQAETIFTQSLLHSLSNQEGVEAVWLFCNGKPWESDIMDWLCPLAPAGMAQSCTLYFCRDTVNRSFKQGEESLVPVQVKFVSSGSVGEENCLFKKIIDLLSRDYDLSYRAPLPRENHVLGFSLVDGRLNIDLAAPFSAASGREEVLIEALVYTFTGLPEIDTVTVTVEGRPLECGGVTWDQPRCRDDLGR